jgi:translocation and assembly module TamA
VLLAAGAGLRYLTPIGPVRLDIGRRLPFGHPPELLAVDMSGNIQQQSYTVDDSCFGLGGSARSTNGASGTMVTVSDNLCALQISIGEAF